MSLAAIPPKQPTLMEGASLALMEPYLDSLLKQALSRGDRALLIPFANIQKFGTLNQRMIDALCESYRENGWSVKVRAEQAATPSGLLFECGRGLDQKAASGSAEDLERPSDEDAPRDGASSDSVSPGDESEPALQTPSNASSGDEDQEGQNKAESGDAAEQEDGERGE